MDIGGIPEENYPISQLPLGFGMALTMDEAAMNTYAGMTETEREHLIMRCKDARSKEEMQKIVNSILPDGSAEALMADTEEAGRVQRGEEKDRVL